MQRLFGFDRYFSVFPCRMWRRRLEEGAVDAQRAIGDHTWRWSCGCCSLLLLQSFQYPVWVRVIKSEVCSAPCVRGKHQYNDVHDAVHNSSLYLHTPIHNLESRSFHCRSQWIGIVRKIDDDLKISKVIRINDLKHWFKHHFVVKLY